MEVVNWIETKRKEACDKASPLGKEIVTRVAAEIKTSAKPAFSESLRAANRARNKGKDK